MKAKKITSMETKDLRKEFETSLEQIKKGIETVKSQLDGFKYCIDAYPYIVEVGAYTLGGNGDELETTYTPVRFTKKATEEILEHDKFFSQPSWAKGQKIDVQPKVWNAIDWYKYQLESLQKTKKAIENYLGL